MVSLDTRSVLKRPTPKRTVIPSQFAYTTVSWFGLRCIGQRVAPKLHTHKHQIAVLCLLLGQKTHGQGQLKGSPCLV